MKFFKLLALFMLAGIPLIAQDFPGYRAGNYTGVNGVFFNPANIADSRYRWDLNLFAVNVSVGNSNAAYKLNDFSNSFDLDTLKEQIFGDQAGPVSALINLNITGPSLMFNTGKKMTFAITTRARAMVNMNDIDGKLANNIVNDANDDFPYTISNNQNMAVSVNGWKEIGLSVARVLKDDGKHFLKGGLTLKYLGGAMNGYVNINRINATLDEDLANDTYIRDATGSLAVGLAGIKIDDFDVEDLLKFESSGFGGDIGFVYEYRPDSEKYKSEENKWKRDENKYKLRIGAALTDIGSIKYEKDMNRSGAYNINVNGGERLYTNEFDGVELDSLKKFFDDRPQYFTDIPTGDAEDEVKMVLPSTLQLDVDYHIHRGFYVSAAAQLALTKMDTKPYNSQYYNSFSLTPRFEGRGLGIYLPLSYSELTELNAGISLRMGPFFIGSGSVITALLGDARQADFHFGLHISSLQKKNPKTKKPKKEKPVDPA